MGNSLMRDLPLRPYGVSDLCLACEATGCSIKNPKRGRRFAFVTECASFSETKKEVKWIIGKSKPTKKQVKDIKKKIKLSKPLCGRGRILDT